MFMMNFKIEPLSDSLSFQQSLVNTAMAVANMNGFALGMLSPLNFIAAAYRLNRCYANVCGLV
jgi:hypothetical protein